MKFFLLTMFLIPLATFNTHASERFECMGTEPFWGAVIEEKKISLNFFDNNPRANFAVTSKKEALGTSGNFAFSLAAINGDNELLTINIIRNKCNDGMSDREYPYTALLEVDSRLYYGCCL